MALKCVAADLTEAQRNKLVAVLETMGFKPKVRDDSVVLDYGGAFDHRAMAIIAVFEQFGGARAILFSK